VTEPSFDGSYVPPPRRLGRRSVIAWLVLLLIVIGAVATLLVWVTHRLTGIAQ
jgi:hypothetical protein